MKLLSSRGFSALAGITVLAAAAAVTPASAACDSHAQKLIDDLNGNWRGSGTVTPIGGSRGRISCRVSYHSRGSRVTQSISCNGSDYSIDAGADVTCDGSHISGVWNERVANNTGRINGRISGNHLNISVNGPNFQGRFAVRVSGRSRHSLTIAQFDPAAGRYVAVASVSLTR